MDKKSNKKQWHGRGREICPESVAFIHPADSKVNNSVCHVSPKGSYKYLNIKGNKRPFLLKSDHKNARWGDVLFQWMSTLIMFLWKMSCNKCAQGVHNLTYIKQITHTYSRYLKLLRRLYPLFAL